MKKQKVGTTRITTRKVNGKRRKVKVTKVSSKKYKVRVIGKKK